MKLGVFPNKALESLEFHKIIKLLMSFCNGPGSAEMVERIQFFIEKEPIQTELTLVDEMLKSIRDNQHIRIHAFENILPSLKKLAVEDFVLDRSSLIDIYRILKNWDEIHKYFNKDRQESYANLYEQVKHILPEKEIQKSFDKVFDDEFNIRDDASPLLIEISAALRKKEKELNRSFNSILSKYKSLGYLSENGESVRNGRRVLSVAAEHKRKIKGIVHGESATGRTAFVEPELIIEFNNDIQELFSEREKEIYKILRDLCALLRHAKEGIGVIYKKLSRLDFLKAKGQLAAKMNAVLPNIIDQVHFGFKQAKHPLLYLKNLEDRKETIPFDLELKAANRILLLSGPNAGGKSILLKTVGLLQLMLQAGLLVTVDENSTLGVFSKIAIDIGDQQSIENDLSTYSSRLSNLKLFLDQADDKTLILLDEFGSGTDPKMGGALAESLLDVFKNRGVFGVITTHYSNLKVFAFKNKGLVNGAMLFDNEKLIPKYELKIGKPGSSYAFEVAAKSGIDQEIIKIARKKLGKGLVSLEDMLVGMRKNQEDLTKKLDKVKAKEKQLDRMIKSYGSMSEDLDIKKKRLKMEAKHSQLQSSADYQKALERRIKELSKEKNLEKLKTSSKKLTKEKKEIKEEIKEIDEALLQQIKVEQRALKKGDFVKYRGSGQTGNIESIKRQKAEVIFGTVKMTMALRDLTLANEPVAIKTTSSIQSDLLDSQLDFKEKIDIRGLRKSEALDILEKYFDEALMLNIPKLYIIHGLGDGVLKRVVHDKLREYNNVESVYHPKHEEGGLGVSVVAFN